MCIIRTKSSVRGVMGRGNRIELSLVSKRMVLNSEIKPMITMIMINEKKIVEKKKRALLPFINIVDIKPPIML